MKSVIMSWSDYELKAMGVLNVCVFYDSNESAPSEVDVRMEFSVVLNCGICPLMMLSNKYEKKIFEVRRHYPQSLTHW